MKIHTERITLALVSLSAVLAVILYSISTKFGGCGSDVHCLSVLVYGAPFQYYFLPALALLLSLIPLFFTKEHAYVAWRKFAVWALPIMLVFIFTSPTHTGGGWALNFDIDREMASLFSALVFTIASWLITVRTALKH